MIDAEAMLWPVTSPMTSPTRPPSSGKASYQSPDVGALGGGQVAHREIPLADQGQGAGQNGALEGLRDGVLAGERGRGGQRVGQAPGGLLAHRDVRAGE